MNKPVPPDDAQDRAEPTDAPRDVGRTGSPQAGNETDQAVPRGRAGRDAETDPTAEPDRDGDGDEDTPKHDVIDLRPSKPAKKERSDQDKDGQKGDADANEKDSRHTEARKGDDSREDMEGREDEDHRDKRDEKEGPEARRRGDDKRADDEEQKTDEGGKGGEDEKSDEPPPKAPPKIVFIAVAVVLLLCLAWGAYTHWKTYHESQQTTSETLNRPVDVRTIAAQREDGPTTLTLPGQTDAFDTANIYARATGYISQRRVDIGTRVKAGDLLLHIAAPDLDKQLAQAEAQLGQAQAALVQDRAQVAQAEANLNLAKVTFARTNQLTQQGYESQQNRDNQQANVQTQQANVEAAKAGVAVGEANIKAQQATVDRLKTLTEFEDVRAPFDGVITSRSVDVGDLVNADTSTGSPMFTMVRDTVVRVTVRVPQNSAIGMLDGLEATVHVPQMPDRPFKGRVARTSSALLYSSRSLTAEVDVPNPDGQLRAGLYVTADFQIPRQHANVSVPAEALIFNQLGLQVATVEDNKAKLHTVTIFRDHGTTLELRDGLEGGERVVVSPPATLAEGNAVKETREEDAKKDDAKKGDAKGQKPDDKGGGEKKDGGK